MGLVSCGFRLKEKPSDELLRHVCAPSRANTLEPTRQQVAQSILQETQSRDLITMERKRIERQ